MFNNKTFLDLIDKLSWQIHTKSRKHKKQKTQRVSKPRQYLWPYFVKWILFIHWKNTEALKFLIKVYPMKDFTEDFSSSINCQCSTMQLHSIKPPCRASTGPNISSEDTRNYWIIREWESLHLFSISLSKRYCAEGQ